MTTIRSRDNVRAKRWRKLLADSQARRGEGRVLIEGLHLVSEAIARGVRIVEILIRESATEDSEVAHLVSRTSLPPVILADRVFDSLSALDAPGAVAAVICLPSEQTDLCAAGGCVFLERIQDAGNIGAIVRSAAAFGVGCVLTDPGCADPWSGKALRAAQGGHFYVSVARSDNLGRSSTELYEIRY